MGARVDGKTGLIMGADKLDVEQKWMQNIWTSCKVHSVVRPVFPLKKWKIARNSVGSYTVLVFQRATLVS